jgi:ATP-dependent DNA helicase DinG
MPRARDLLGPAGPLARSLAHYEDRPGQLAMADAVERALAHDRVLACEAGTGTGKTLAYLVPAVLSGKKVVISTATRALQEQIFEKDIPLLRRSLGLEVSAALMKGLQNYLCLRRFDEFRRSPEAADLRMARALSVIERWAASTKSGDVADIDGLSEDEPIWREVSSSSDTRIGQECEHYRECFVTRMKRQAEAARLVVVNHHLFFADLALRGPHAGAALPDYDAVIFDEAHQLEDIATDFFGVHVSLARIAALLRDADRAFAPAERASTLRRTPAALIGPATEAAHRFFSAVAFRAATIGAGDGKTTIDASFFGTELRDDYHKLDAAVEAVGAAARTRGSAENLEVVARRVAELREDLAHIIDGMPNYVGWIETRMRGAALGASPVNIANLLKGRLFAQVPSVILTSATLTTNHSFSFLRSRLGLDSEDVDVDELEVASPFDYPNRALVYLPRDLPDPSDPAWLRAAEKRIVELIDATQGGAFVLCTSKRVMTELHAHLAERAAGSAQPRRLLLVQGQAPKGVLLDRFRKAENAVLVATMSFWEGVDVPGHALRLVIIDKIPFLVPSDPVVMARGAAIEAAGRNPFVVYQVPSAAITLKQGFGRLIRTRQDAGIVALLDRRVHTKGYGRTLIQSLPPARRTDDLGQVKAFAQTLVAAIPVDVTRVTA